MTRLRWKISTWLNTMKKKKEKETKEDAKMIRVEHQDVRNNCCLVFTSGTSGNARKQPSFRIPISPRRLIRSCTIKTVPNIIARTYICIVRRFITWGGLISGLAAIKADAKHIFLESFDARSFLHAIVTAEVTAFIAVPTMLRKIQRICKDTHMTPRPTTVSSAVQSSLLGLSPSRKF